jgi:DinB superfamily
MDWRELIVDGYDRLPDLMKEVLAGVRAADLDRPPHPDGNTLGWTAWHLTRVQDSQIADLMGEAQLWIRDGWHRKFGRPADPDDTGYGHTLEQVRDFRSPSVATQLAYLRRVVERTKAYLASVRPSELERELDEPWYRPRPTVAVRIVSILADCHQHAGEASYVRGWLKTAARRSKTTSRGRGASGSRARTKAAPRRRRS